MIIDDDPQESGERWFAIACSSLLLIVAAFALIGLTAVCKWLAGIQ